MSAFLPESDSEDELPPGWEERATLQGEVKTIPLPIPSHIMTAGRVDTLPLQ